MIKLALAGCALLCLSACSTLDASGGADAAKAVLGNLEHCERDYIASVGGLGVPGGSLHIKCPAKPFDAPAPVP